MVAVSGVTVRVPNTGATLATAMGTLAEATSSLGSVMVTRIVKLEAGAFGLSR